MAELFFLYLFILIIPCYLQSKLLSVSGLYNLLDFPIVSCVGYICRIFKCSLALLSAEDLKLVDLSHI